MKIADIPNDQFKKHEFGKVQSKGHVKEVYFFDYNRVGYLKIYFVPKFFILS